MCFLLFGYLKRISKTIITLLLLFAFTQAAYAANSTVNPGEIIINEISWGGSSLNKTTSPTFYDEWIELYNTTDHEIDLSGLIIYGVGGSTTGIPLQGSVKPNDFFLLTKIPTPNPRSIIRTPSDQASSKLSISNSGFDIILKNQGTEIDRVNSSDKPFAGQSTDDLKTSMSKLDPKIDGSKPESWKNSTERTNLHNAITNPNVTCGIDFGTPKARNFPLDQNRKTIEFEESCISEGNIESQNGRQYLSITGPRNQEKIFQIPIRFESDAGYYEIILNYGSQSILNNTQNSGTLKLNIGEEYTTNTKIYFLNQEQSNTKIEIAKPKGITEGILSIDLNLGDDSKILLDSINIDKIPQSSLSPIIAKDLLSTEWQNKFDETLHKEVKFLDKALNSPSLISTENSSSPIDLDKYQYFSSIYNLKFTNITPEISENDILAKIRIYNSFTKSENIRNIRKNEVIDNTYQEFLQKFLSEKYGNYNFELITYGKADIWFDDITFTLLSHSDKEVFHIEDLVYDESYSYNSEDQSFRFFNASEKSRKILGLTPAYHCLFTKQCKLSIEVHLNNDKNNNNSNVYIFGQYESGEKFFKNKRISLSKSEKNEPEMIDFDIPIEGFSKVGFIVNLDPHSSISIKNIEIFPITAKPPKEIFLDKLRSIQFPLKLQTSIDSNGYKGSLINILNTEDLVPGEYNLELTINKKEKFSTSNEIISILAYDQFGKKLLEKEIKENDLTFFKDTKVSNNLTVISKSKIYITVKFFGNSKEAYADIEVTNLFLTKK